MAFDFFSIEFEYTTWIPLAVDNISDLYLFGFPMKKGLTGTGAPKCQRALF